MAKAKSLPGTSKSKTPERRLASRAKKHLAHAFREHPDRTQKCDNQSMPILDDTRLPDPVGWGEARKRNDRQPHAPLQFRSQVQS